MRESASLRFLYHTIPSRQILKLLVQPSVSKAAAHFMDSPASRPLIGHYVRKYHIDLTGCEKQEFDSFNDFFTRKRRTKLCADENALLSPCDGYLSVYRITENLQMQIKHSTYTVADLLQNDILASRFRGGICCIFRLEPQHYHRYIYAVSGEVQKQETIPGILHCVRPIACREFPVYVQNSRTYTLIESPALGSVVQMEIGALLVRKIHNHKHSAHAVSSTEKGYFEYGGSTIVLLFQKDAVQLLPKFGSTMQSGCEKNVTLGQVIGRIPH